MSLKFYHYAKCDACRRALKFLRNRNIPFTAIPIRETPPARLEIERMLGYYGGDVRRLFNTSGKDYQEMRLKDRLPGMSKEEAIALLAGHGNLIKRPFALTGRMGRVGFKEEEWMIFL